MSLKGNIFKISHYAIHDGPGIRTTVFMKGCPARCLWCCSPESQKFERDIAFKTNLCISCGRCAVGCPRGAISGEINKNGIDLQRCNLCGICVDICPKGAIEIIGQSVTPEELFDFVLKDRPFWRRSGGGVTLSGGELLLQPDFAIGFLSLCRSRGVHTAIETCLFSDFETVNAVAGLADFIQFDIKAISPKLHARLTSLDNAQILENAASLLRSDRRLLVRYPLVPGCNDSEDELEALGRFCANSRPGAIIELLPYHSMGAGSYEALGREYVLADTQPPTSGAMRRAAEVLRRCELTVIYQ